MKAVLATDLSAASEATIHNETCLACLGRIGVEEIHLVTVIPANVHRGMPGIDFEKRRRRAIRSYERVITDAGFDSDVHVVRGTPHRRIRGLAETLGASLTIVGSRGKSPLENRIIGSTARNLARTTETPLIVNRIERGTDDPSVVKAQLFRRMLYATDFSENADRAFESFSYLRHATKEVTLVHVETPKDPGDGEDPADRLEALAAQLADWDRDPDRGPAGRPDGGDTGGRGGGRSDDDARRISGAKPASTAAHRKRLGGHRRTGRGQRDDRPAVVGYKRGSGSQNPLRTNPISRRPGPPCSRPPAYSGGLPARTHRGTSRPRPTGSSRSRPRGSRRRHPGRYPTAPSRRRRLTRR